MAVLLDAAITPLDYIEGYFDEILIIGAIVLAALAVTAGVILAIVVNKKKKKDK